MAAEYEIKNIGYIGSLWQDNFQPPINVGKTIEVANVPNTIERGGYSKAAVYFGSKENLDIDKLTRQYPDDSKYYSIRRLTQSEADELQQATKLSAEFSKQLDALFFFDRRGGVIGGGSLVPIQEIWGSFDTSVPNDPEYVLPLPEFLTYANFILLVNESQLDSLTTYFSEIQQVETIFQPPVIANPSSILIPPQAPVMGFPSYPRNIYFDFQNQNLTPTDQEIVQVLTEQVVHRIDYDVADVDLLTDVEASKRFMQIVGGTENRFFVSGDDEYNTRISELDIALDRLQTLSVTPKMSTVMPPIQDTVIVVSDESANAMI